VFESQLEIYKIVFTAELLLSETMFIYRRNRRRHFVLRAIFSVLVCFAVSVLYPVLAYNAIYSSIMFFVLFAVTVLLLKFCFDESWYNVLFCAIAAYTVQHLSYEIFNFIGNVSGLNELSSNFVYSNEHPLLPNLYIVILYFGVYATVYWLMFCIFGDRITHSGAISLKGGWLLMLAGLILLVDIILNMIVVYQSYKENSLVYTCVSFIYNVMCCILALTVQFGLLTRKILQDELITVNGLRKRERQQYNFSKESIALINRKAHDLKHQIRRFGQTESISKEAIAELEKAVNVYDTSVKTDNKALDTILSEKKLYCTMNDIKLTCIADGAQLSFMKDVDIYSLFGNVLDNAIEAVMKLEPSKRVIGLIVKAQHDVISVCCYNYYSGELIVKDGMPLTSKANEKYHGFGVSSIRATTEQYGGNMAINTENGVFRVNLMIPAGGVGVVAAAVSEERSVSRKRLTLYIVPPAAIAIIVSFALMAVSWFYLFTNWF